MPRISKEKNIFQYVIYEGEECVKFQTVGKYNYEVIVDKDSWEKYLSKYTWTISMQNGRPSAKTSIYKQTTFIWKLIIEQEKDELDSWGTTIDHINHNPLDNRKSNLQIFNSAILNSTNVSSKFEGDDRQYIHKISSGYKIHYNLAGQTFYLGTFSIKKYGSEEAALSAAKAFRDKYVIEDRKRIVKEMIKKTRDVEFERGLRDKLNAGEKNEVFEILSKYGINVKDKP